MAKLKVPKLLTITLLVIAIILSPIILFISGMLVFMVGTITVTSINYIFTPNPPKPETTYAEFPFEIVYEVDGEITTITDIYVCEFDGFASNSSGKEKHRRWKGYIKSTGEEYIILVDDGNLQLLCSIGDAGYYMGDSDYTVNEPMIFYKKTDDLGTGIGSLPDDVEKLTERYKLKLISWHMSEPINNSFD